MVNLTRIYTRTGDAGRTRLSDLSETTKTDPRVDAYGDVDEANSLLGIVTTQADLPEHVREVLRHIQNELFDCGADLSNPLVANPPYEPLRIIHPNIANYQLRPLSQNKRSGREIGGFLRLGETLIDYFGLASQHHDLEPADEHKCRREDDRPQV